ncbi:MAG: PorV/PorQ family protein [Candidatus Marinimicrobia bacterium]|nr:PorV/PorQ family protein [Candidatus Neomarinimicrobiota bacterium]
MKKQISLFLIFFLIINAAGLRGQAFFQGLNHPVNARGWGMGSAASSQSKSASGVLYNPAVIAHSPDLWQVNHTMFPLDISTSSAYTVFTTPAPGKFAMLFSYLNYGSFTERDWEGAETGSFGVYDLTSSVAYSRKLSRRLSVGLSTALTQSRLNSLTASAILGSVGILYYNEISTLSIGLCYRNFGVLIDSFSGKNEPLPSMLMAGISKKLAHLPMILSVDAYQAYRDEYVANIGGEFIIGEHLFLRWGNSTRRFQIRGQESFKNFFSSASAGLGINFRSFVFDFAVVGLSDAGNISSISITQYL